MSTSDERIAVFQDTMNWIDSDPDLSASISAAKKNTTVFYEDDYPAFNASDTKDMLITVSGDRSYQAAMRLYKESPGSKIAVMNFANAFHAGGGVTKGSSAQEESLCRTSTLYPLLYRRTLRDTFYKHHHDLNTPKATDSLIYTEGVIICKTDEDLPKRMPKEDWVSVDVITVAAPDLRDKSNKHAPLVNGGTYMNNAELFGYHVKRAIHMLTCAAAKGADILVLGAFGCGAFQNDPEVVARAYKTVLKEFPKVFKQVEFAIYRPASGSKNYDVFKRILDTRNVEEVSKEVVPEKRKGTSSKIELLHASCADQTVDAVVNAANDGLWAGGGICGVIFKKAGMRELTEACEKYDTPLKDGEAVITPAFNMKNTKAIIHAVGPNFGVTPTAFEELFKAYYNSLLVLKDNDYHSISFPLISSSIFGGNLENPVAESTKQCVRAYKRFTEDFPDYEIDVKLCAFGSSEMEKAKKQFDEQIKSPSDETKISEKDLSVIFERKPTQWGLRGDPYLWEEMKDHCVGESLDIDDYGIAAFVGEYFEKATGKALSFDTDVYVERFAHGGMSSGSVSGSFWLSKGIPFLIENLRRAKAGYPVITLCGSTRFKDAFIEAQKRLTLEGNIVISVGLFGHSDDEEVWDGMDEGTFSKTKKMLDDMHRRKIDMADEIYVINVGGYIGESTRYEIEYAEMHDKRVRYLEEQ